MNHSQTKKTLQLGIIAIIVLALGLLATLFLDVGLVPRLVSAGLLAAAAVYAIAGLYRRYLDLNHWYEQILDFVYLPMSITDKDMNWTFINKPVKDIIGKTREDIIGKQCSGWGADICKTEKCGIAMLRKGMKTSYFTNEGVNRNFQVDTTYLYDRKDPKKMVGHLELVSDVTTKFRLGSAVERLREASEGVAKTIDSEAATTTELSATSIEFSRTLDSIKGNVEKQNNYIDETVSAIEEMSASVQTVADHAGRASRTSEENAKAAQEGERVIRESIRQVADLNGSLSQIAEKITGLGAKTEAIDDILKVINAIAAQTNLLAMNAAIEAAHAGDSGRGFSVVADEIRKLAENAQRSAKEISKIVKEIKVEIADSVVISKKGKELSDFNMKNTETTLSSLESIVGAISRISSMVVDIDHIAKEQSDVTGSVLGNTRGLKEVSQEILQAIAEQSAGIQEITRSLQILASNTQENARSAEGLASTAKSLEL